MKNKTKKNISLLNAEAQENILELLNHVKEERGYRNKSICLNIALDRLAYITENENILDTIADILIEEIR